MDDFNFDLDLERNTQKVLVAVWVRNEGPWMKTVVDTGSKGEESNAVRGGGWNNRV